MPYNPIANIVVIRIENKGKIWIKYFVVSIEVLKHKSLKKPACVAQTPFWRANKCSRLGNVIFNLKRTKNLFSIFSNTFKTFQDGIHK